MGKRSSADEENSAARGTGADNADSVKTKNRNGSSRSWTPPLMMKSNPSWKPSTLDSRH